MLRLRIVSATVLAVPVLLCVVAGSPYFDILVAVGAMVMVWEWFRLCSESFPMTEAAAGGISVLVALVLTSLGEPRTALVTLAGGAVVLALLSRGQWWLSAGPLYIGLPAVALVWLRADPALGLETVIWLLAMVWASDVGAYAAGRAIGGPKLAATWSPNKTWAGLIGATASAGAVGAVTAGLLAMASVWPLALASAALGAAAQGGDLFESFAKRRFGVKDTSTLIPGHGGLLDRVDGLVAAVVLTALIGAIGNGSMLAWI
ncbi:MAG: phosphatidate cytidylyltransferase [Rhodospirillales bacterium]|nr:MAG: phosphatidate cytidylyltransferase [Rhodospirillales bacterium]